VAVAAAELSSAAVFAGATAVASTLTGTD